MTAGGPPPRFEIMKTVFLNFDHCNNRRPQGCICQIFTGGSEFRLATSDYSGHGGCQIGTVE